MSGFFGSLIFFFLKTLISLLGDAEVTAIVWQLFRIFFHISASFGKTTMGYDHTHIWFAMEISIFITHLQIAHYVERVN